MDELEVFSTALEISSLPERVQFLDEACGDNAALRRRIESLLESWHDAGDFLTSPAPHLEHFLRDRVDSAGKNRDSAAAVGTLGDFRLLREIGRGGMGVVYEAEQTSLGRRVAVKVLPFFDARDPRQVLRFQNESRAAASLKHPHIVSVHSVGYERGLHYYAMDYIEGRTLADVIAHLQVASGLASSPARDDAGTVPYHQHVDTETDPTAPVAATVISTRTCEEPGEFFRTLAQWGIQAAEGLDHAHALGIVHRDIKPSNLLVDPTGQLWVTDFGLAMSDTFPGPTMTGDLLGTLRYMSPEQVSGERRVLDGRTDIYSLGVTLYELVTLQPAFPGENLRDIMRQIAETDPRPPRQLNKCIPRDLETILLKAMAKEPPARYPTSHALADDLRRFLADEPIAAQRPSTWERAGKWSRRHRSLVWAAASLLIVTTLLSVTGIVFVARERREALRQRDEAERQRDEVRRREASLRRHLNVANIHWAWQAWHSGKLDQARDYLAQQQPDPGEEDTRSFAWYYLWRLCHNSCTVLSGHTGPVYSLAFSPDGTTLVSGGTDHKIVHWDVATGQERTRWEDFPDDVNFISFSSDGRMIATAGEEQRVRTWDAASGQPLQSFTGFERPVAAALFSPDNQHLFAAEVAWADNWGHTSLWDLSTGQRQTRFGGRVLAISPDGQTVLLNKGLWKWDAEVSQDEPRILGPPLPGLVITGAFSPNGETVASGGMERAIHVQKVPGRERVTTLYWHTAAVRSLAFSPDGTLLASGGDDGRVLLWDTLSWDLQGVLPSDGHRMWIVIFSADGSRLAAGCEDGKIRMWDPATSRARVGLRVDLPQQCSLGYLSNDELVLVGYPEPSSWGMWNVATGRLVKSFELPGEKIESLAASPLAPLVALGTSGGTVRLVDRVSGETRYTFPPDKAGKWLMRQLAFSPDGRYLAGARARGASADDPRTFLITVWDVAGGQELLARPLAAPQNAAHAQPFAFSPDSQTLAAPFEDQVHLCDLVSRTIRLMPGNRFSKVWSVAYSPDGQWLALSTDDWSLRLVDPHNAAGGKTLVGTRGIANALEFSPDGRTLVSGSSAGEVTLWDVQMGEEMCVLEGPTGPIQRLAFSPDGTRLAATSETPAGRHAVHIWHAPRPTDTDVITANQQSIESP